MSLRRFLRRFLHPTWRDTLIIGLPSLALIGLSLWFGGYFFRPGAPDHLVMTTGAADGAYQIFAARYKEILASKSIGVTLETKESKGAMENLDALLDPKKKVDIGFLQTGIARGRDVNGLVSLGVLYPEPLWVFYRGEEKLTSLDQLKGKRIAIGPEGSGTRSLALELLRAHGMDSGQGTLSDLGGINAAIELDKGTLDAVFVVGAAQSAAVWTLLYSKGVKLFSFAQAQAYARRFPDLSVLQLPRGTIDFQQNIPDQDVTLIGPMAVLAARENLDPAVIGVLVDAAITVHGGAGPFQTAGQYPTPHGGDLPVSEDAENYYRSGKGFLYRYLPFRWANRVDRLLRLLIPLLAVILPLARIAPSFYALRVRSRVFRYYGQLKLLELDARNNPSSKSQQEWLAELDRIEQAANRISTPNAYADHVYTLRTHINMVRQQLSQRAQKTP